MWKALRGKRHVVVGLVIEPELQRHQILGSL